MIATTFNAEVEQALRHFTDPLRLGKESVLASPYFLGVHLAAPSADAASRGRALQALLRLAAEKIDGRYRERYQTILVERYFKGRQLKFVMEEVGLERNSMNLSRKAAIEALEAALINEIRPSLRPEPLPEVRNPLRLVNQLDQFGAYLSKGESVTLLGPTGSGKSVLARQLAQASGRPIFWFTVRTGITDTVESFVFALGLFAYRQGQPALWLELVAGQGKIKREALMSLLNHTLAQLHPAPLLCIDDADLLASNGDGVHGGLIHVLDALRLLTPLLLVGQRSVIGTLHYLPVPALSLANTQKLFAQRGLDVPPADLQLYHAWTQGNLSLLHLCAELRATAPHELTAIEPGSERPLLDLLLPPIIANLTPAEQTILARLSVFRRAVPIDFFGQGKLPEADGATALHRLRDREIVTYDEGGGVVLSPIYQRVVYPGLAPAARRRLHADAARVRSAYGERFAAIYHLLQAERVEEAIDLWQMIGRQETEQGQARAALKLFQTTLERSTLTDALRDALHGFCAELDYFLGNLDQTEVDVEAISEIEPLFTVAGLEIRGKLENDRGRFAEAERAFATALARADVLLEVRRVRIRKGMAWMHLRQRDFVQVERELTQAQFEIENMRGNLAYDQSRYAVAAEHYAIALALAKESGSRDAVAKTEHNLAMIQMVRGEYADSLAALKRVCRHYAAMQRVAAVAGCHTTMAVVANLAGEHDRAMALLDAADAHLAQLAEVAPWQRGLVSQARAEALLGLGDPAAACEQVQAVIAIDDVTLLPDAYRTYGEILTRHGAWQEAEVYLRRAIEAAEANEDLWLLGYAWRALGEFHLAQEDALNAAAALNQAIDHFSAIDLRGEIVRCRQLLPTPVKASRSP